jgi:hypothetical protein
VKELASLCVIGFSTYAHRAKILRVQGEFAHTKILGLASFALSESQHERMIAHRHSPFSTMEDKPKKNTLPNMERPGVRDILFGRGNVVFNHLGNR